MTKSVSRTPAASSTTTPIRVLKTGKCTSNSGKSKLTYQIGSANGTDIHVRVTGNTGSGFFSNEWIRLSDIESICVKGKPITSHQLFSLYRGKSINTPAFLLAALVSEGLLQKGTKQRRTYEATDAAPYKATVRKLYATGVNVPAGNAARREGPAKETPKPEAGSPAKAPMATPKATAKAKKPPAPKAKKK